VTILTSRRGVSDASGHMNNGFAEASGAPWPPPLANGKAPLPKGKAPPPPKRGGRGPPKAAPPMPKNPSKGGGAGMSELLRRVEATGQKKDREEAKAIEDVDLSKIDPNATRPRVKCPRCELQVLVSDYESHMSSHSSEIMLWLFLGGIRNAENDKELTLRTGITHILNLASECNLWGDVRVAVEKYQAEQGLSFTYKKYPFGDTADQDILNDLPEAIEFIHNAHLSNDRHHVLVHCVQGISRSASVVIAYLIKYEGMTLRDAHAHTLKCRPIAMPRKEFVDQLGRFECAVLGCAEPSFTGEQAFEGKVMLSLDAGLPVAQKWTRSVSDLAKHSGTLVRTNTPGIVSRVLVAIWRGVQSMIPSCVPPAPVQDNNELVVEAAPATEQRPKS